MITRSWCMFNSWLQDPTVCLIHDHKIQFMFNSWSQDPSVYLIHDHNCIECCSVSLLSRCMPDPSALIGGDGEKGNVTADDIESIIDFLNADDIFRQVLSDLYTSWKELIYLVLIALGRYPVPMVLFFHQNPQEWYVYMLTHSYPQKTL